MNIESFTDSLKNALQRSEDIIKDLNENPLDDPFEEVIRKGIDEWEQLCKEMIKVVKGDA